MLSMGSGEEKCEEDLKKGIKGTHLENIYHA